MAEPDATPRFSVVVPAYNEAAYLGATLRSLQQQDFAGGVEILVVDNNSTDATAAIARAAGVRVISETRPGVCPARQAGTEAARGEIVVSTDADTRQPRDWLRRLDARFTDPGVVLVGGPCRYDHPTWWSRRYPRLLFGLVGWWYARTGRVFYATATNSAFRRAVFPGYDVTQTQGGDEFGLLHALRGRGRMVWDPEIVVTTSARRLEAGFVHSVLVTFVFYYLFGYALNRVAGRTVLPMAPPVRGDRPRRRLFRIGLPLGALLLVTLGLVGWAWPDQAVEFARRLRP
ncbi:glycosyltransferase involved in cell wall biosynthesis [Friedmanniella endophytica]|uniref:Glycosyltransferase involved in cell wall biosynthesis n=1 Tax=Microlunatus kandeliicorticis TaxID=1759536 RepID=A0A7W3IVV1_9ACTN|nr:glycosyltransferase family 2 protein [Microlunatus kandeliicorticis]MBA8796149.1 glycosyltransferase involved in cell wall biosynthesis [Microlunatus kandeliicorticis]